jgi:hypothetical protein
MAESIRAGAEREAIDYNYEHFTLADRTLDRLEGPQTGDQAPDFVATCLDGTQVRLSEYRGRFVVLEVGSASCPMYERGIVRMNALAYRFPEVAFLVLYTREAHPGENLGPHRSMADKLGAARLLTEADREGRTVLVDDLWGSAHRLYGEMPNTVHIVDPNGEVAFRTMWNDPEVVEAALTRVLAGASPAGLRPRFRPAPPRILFRVLRRAGRRALGDFVRAFPKVTWEHLKPARDESRERWLFLR